MRHGGTILEPWVNRCQGAVSLAMNRRSERHGGHPGEPSENPRDRPALGGLPLGVGIDGGLPGRPAAIASLIDAADAITRLIVMFEGGVLGALRGITMLEEVFRVSKRVEN
jgi:hypothetical protein